MRIAKARKLVILMSIIFKHSKAVFLFALMGALSIEIMTERVEAQATASTDLAEAVITPLSPNPNASSDWQTVYDYSGGEAPPGTRIAVVGKTTG